MSISCSGSLPVLTLVQQYNADLGVVRRLSSQEEEEYVERARVGDKTARETIICSLLPYARALAAKYERLSHACGRMRVEYLDLVQVGSVTLLEVFEVALTHPNPFGYLKRAVSGEIVRYCVKYGSLIVSPQQHGRGYLPLKDVDSLDAVLCVSSGKSRGKDDDVTLLDLLSLPVMTSQLGERDLSPCIQQALESLTERQREVIVRHYGIDCAPESLYDISQDFLQRLGKPMKMNPSTAYSTHKGALTSLKRKLESVLFGEMSEVA